MPKLAERLSIIEKLSFRTAAVIQQLLTFSRKSKPSLAPIPIDSFLKESIKLQRVSLPENISIQLEVQDQKMRIQGDINLLQQALINLFNNARDALNGIKDPVIQVVLNRFTSDKAFRTANPSIHATEFAHIRLSDNGCGIAPEDMEHIFEPFFTTKEVGKGTGLGLSMVYGAIQSHNGAITIESGKTGTTFNIYLPLINPSATEFAELKPIQELPGNGETILLVDDDQQMLTTSRDVLESLNYQVITAQDGHEAVETYQKHQNEIDLVILDVVMPKMGGKEACEAIRALNPEAKVLFATGYDRSNILDDSVLANMLVINKPFLVSKLSQSLRGLLEN